MKQEQLKKLAEWAGVRLMTLEDETLAVAIPYEVNDLEGNLPDKLWQPHVDSNQLDMLKKKFIKELRLKYYPSLLKIKIIVARNGVYCLDIFVEQSKGWLRLPELEEAGDNDNECWLNAILNYVEKK